MIPHQINEPLLIMLIDMSVCFVEDVERRRVDSLEREDEGDGEKRLLTAGKRRNRLHRHGTVVEGGWRRGREEEG